MESDITTRRHKFLSTSMSRGSGAAAYAAISASSIISVIFKLVVFILLEVLVDEVWNEKVTICYVTLRFKPQYPIEKRESKLFLTRAELLSVISLSV